MRLEKPSPCKVNLLLNILGKRPDGFHELETVMQPVRLFDRLSFEITGDRVALTCSLPGLPADSTNLVHRAASLFLGEARIRAGVRIHLDKQIPLAAGLGGGSGNAATTLLALNELFGTPLDPTTLTGLAARLGSDVPFFLQDRPALATGRGEHIEPLEPFAALRGLALVLVHPGFGISTGWAYGELARFPDALHGRAGRARELAARLQGTERAGIGTALYNSLEAPALHKYPILALYQQFFRENGAVAALMSGSGSTTFALMQSQAEGEQLAERFREKFGMAGWMTVVPV
jgi:4-diphosphocytidyl-2-C-methyl-D-erythritol kinase